MAITFTNGNATISTAEYSLPAATTSGVPTSQTADGVYQCWIDFGAMVAGDQYQIRVYEKTDGAGTQRLVDEWILTGPQAKPMFVIPSLILGEGWDITVDRLAGSDRAIRWSIRSVA